MGLKLLRVINAFKVLDSNIVYSFNEIMSIFVCSTVYNICFCTYEIPVLRPRDNLIIIIVIEKKPRLFFALIPAGGEGVERIGLEDRSRRGEW